MGYENAPSTTLLAVSCAMCAKPLRDANSVEAGMGPDCRSDYGVPEKLSKAKRKRANQLIHHIAVKQHDCDDVREAIEELESLGANRAADRISVRLYGKYVKAWLDGGQLIVSSPFSYAWNTEARRIDSRKWDGGRKVNTFDPGHHGLVEAALGEAYGSQVRVLVAATEAELPKTLGHGVRLKGVFAKLCKGHKPPAKLAAPPTPVKVVRDTESKRIAVYTPYNREMVDFMRTVDGRKWNGGDKVNTFPLDAEEEVLDASRRYFDSIVLVIEEGEVAGKRKRKGGRRARETYGRGY